MIYVFDAKRTLYARLVVEAATAEEAQKKLGNLALENDDYPWVEEESVQLRAAYETFEAAFGADVVTEPRRLKGAFETTSEKPLSLDTVKEPFEKSES